MKSRKTTPETLIIHACVVVSATFLSACGTLQIGVEEIPSPGAGLQGTVSALATENAHLATQAAPNPTASSPEYLEKFAYVQGGDIWMQELPDSEPRRLTTDGSNHSPRWSPSG